MCSWHISFLQVRNRDYREAIGHAENVGFGFVFFFCLPFGKGKRKPTLGNTRQSRDGAAAAAGAVELPGATQADSQNQPKSSHRDRSRSLKENRQI